MPSRAWRNGSTWAWRKLRASVLAANEQDNGGACQLRLPGVWRTRSGRTQRCMGVADCVHHTRGRSVTGDDPRYLMATCTPCNEHVGDPQRRPDPPARPASRW